MFAIEGQYPFGFSVVSATPLGVAGNTLWRLGTLAPGASQTIHIVGTIDASDGDERVFTFLAGSNSDPTDTHVDVPFLTVPQDAHGREALCHWLDNPQRTLNGQTGSAVSVSPGSNCAGHDTVAE